MKKYIILAVIGVLASLVIAQSITMTNTVKVDNSTHIENANIMVADGLSTNRRCTSDKCKVSSSGNQVSARLRAKANREKPQPKKEPRIGLYNVA